MSRRFCTDLLRVYCIRMTMNQEFMERVLVILTSLSRVVQVARMGFVLGEQPGGKLAVGASVRCHQETAQRLMLRHHLTVLVQKHSGLWPAPFVRAAPGPGVAEPQCWQDLQGRQCRAMIDNANSNQNVIGAFLGVFNKHVEVTIAFENPGIHQFQLRKTAAAVLIFLNQPGIGILHLRVLVEPLQVGMSRSGIKMVVLFLDVFTVIALVPVHSEESFLQNRITTIPQRNSKAQAALTITEAKQPVFSPAVSSSACVIMRKPCPRSAVGGIILTHRAPLPIRKIRSPAFPVGTFYAGFFLVQSDEFR